MLYPEQRSNTGRRGIICRFADNLYLLHFAPTKTTIPAYANGTLPRLDSSVLMEQFTEAYTV